MTKRTVKILFPFLRFWPFAYMVCHIETMGAHVQIERKKRNEQKIISRIVVTQKRKLNVTVCYVRSRMGMVMDMVTKYSTCERLCSDFPMEYKLFVLSWSHYELFLFSWFDFFYLFCWNEVLETHSHINAFNYDLFECTNAELRHNFFMITLNWIRISINCTLNECAFFIKCRNFIHHFRWCSVSFQKFLQLSRFMPSSVLFIITIFYLNAQNWIGFPKKDAMN